MLCSGAHTLLRKLLYPASNVRIIIVLKFQTNFLYMTYLHATDCKQDVMKLSLRRSADGDMQILLLWIIEAAQLVWEHSLTYMVVLLDP
jgi:hypothetical protein